MKVSTTPHAAALSLLRKYTALAELRAARAKGEPIPPSVTFKTLAAEFPGALYELDRLPEVEIERRKVDLTEASHTGILAPWMEAMAEYHALYRAALYIKARTPKRATLDAQTCASLAETSARHAGTNVSPSFVQAVCTPTQGRIGLVVSAEVFARFCEEEADLRKILFPTRRTFPLNE